MPILFILLISIPLIELYFLIQVGGIIGGLSTILLIIVTALVGSFFIRQQGMATFLKAQQNMQRGQMPAMELMEGLILVIAGVMLVTPGFITDSLGFLLLLPPLRKALVVSAAKRFVVNTQGMHKPTYKPQEDLPKPTDFIEGEFTKEDK
jgi:UPF0716 protein FxsA